MLGILFGAPPEHLGLERPRRLWGVVDDGLRYGPIADSLAPPFSRVKNGLFGGEARDHAKASSQTIALAARPDEARQCSLTSDVEQAKVRVEVAEVIRSDVMICWPLRCAQTTT